MGTEEFFTWDRTVVVVMALVAAGCFVMAALEKDTRDTRTKKAAAEGKIDLENISPYIGRATKDNQKYFYGGAIGALIIGLAVPPGWAFVSLLVLGFIFILFMVTKIGRDEDYYDEKWLVEKKEREKKKEVERELQFSQKIASIQTEAERAIANRESEALRLKQLREKKELMELEAEDLARTSEQDQLKRRQPVEEFLFEFFNQSQFNIEFIDEPTKQNRGFPEIGWSFNRMKGESAIVPIAHENNFTSFLKRQEFSIHVIRNKGTMHRNPRDVIASNATEIYTHRKMEDYRFIDKEADMNVTMNYYVYISIRVDNIDMDGEQPIARLEEYDWSTRPLKSDGRHYAYFEFDTHRVTREEFVGKVARKQQELDERKAMSRLKEMEQELDDEQGGVRTRLERIAQKFKSGGMQQKRAVDKEIGEIVDEEIANGMNEEDAEALYETLRKTVGM